MTDAARSRRTADRAGEALRRFARGPADDDGPTPFRLALHGAGMISTVHGAAARYARLPVVAVASRSLERATARAGDLGARPCRYDDLPLGADGVIVCTPPADHAGATVRLLAAGAAVMVEKPLATTLDGADAIVAAATTHGQRVLYAENLAHAPVVRSLLAERAAMGAPTYVEARAITPLPTWGDFLTDVWGGGALFDLGVHPLALVLLLAGAPPVTVRARLAGGPGHGTDEHAEVDLRFADGGRGRVVAGWRGTGTPDGAVWDAQAANAHAVVRAELMPEPALERNGEPVALPARRTSSGAIEAYGYLDQLAAFADVAAFADAADLAASADLAPFADLGGPGAATGAGHADAVDRPSGLAPPVSQGPPTSAAFGRAVLDVVCAAYASAGHDGAEQVLPFTGRRDRTPLQLWRGN